MYCNMDAGHGGASGRYEAYKETAMEYAFLIAMTERKQHCDYKDGLIIDYQKTKQFLVNDFRKN